MMPVPHMGASAKRTSGPSRHRRGSGASLGWGLSTRPRNVHCPSAAPSSRPPSSSPASSAPLPAARPLRPSPPGRRSWSSSARSAARRTTTGTRAITSRKRRRRPVRPSSRSTRRTRRGTNVREAVDGANLIVYVGHGNGYPNPYSSGTEYTDRVNGLGPQHRARTTATATTGSTSDMVYCGEKALRGHAHAAERWRSPARRTATAEHHAGPGLHHGLLERLLHPRRQRGLRRSGHRGAWP